MAPHQRNERRKRHERKKEWRGREYKTPRTKPTNYRRLVLTREADLTTCYSVPQLRSLSTHPDEVKPPGPQRTTYGCDNIARHLRIGRQPLGTVYIQPSPRVVSIHIRSSGTLVPRNKRMWKGRRREIRKKCGKPTAENKECKKSTQCRRQTGLIKNGTDSPIWSGPEAR